MDRTKKLSRGEDLNDEKHPGLPNPTYPPSRSGIRALLDSSTDSSSDSSNDDNDYPKDKKRGASAKNEREGNFDNNADDEAKHGKAAADNNKDNDTGPLPGIPNPTDNDNDDSPPSFENEFQPRKFSFLLLHKNDPTQWKEYMRSMVEDKALDSANNPYNPFLNANMNMRRHLNLAKLLPATKSDQEENLVCQTCEGDPFSTPLCGQHTVVLASFESVPDGDKPAAPLYPTYRDKEAPTGRYYAIRLTSEIMLQALLKLRGLKGTVVQDDFDFRKQVAQLNGNVEFTVVDCDKLCQQLSKMYVQEMLALEPPNTSAKVLEEFIRDMDWGSDHVWGGANEEFLDEIAEMKDDWKK